MTPLHSVEIKTSLIFLLLPRACLSFLPSLPSSSSSHSTPCLLDQASCIYRSPSSLHYSFQSNHTPCLLFLFDNGALNPIPQKRTQPSFTPEGLRLGRLPRRASLLPRRYTSALAVNPSSAIATCTLSPDIEGKRSCSIKLVRVAGTFQTSFNYLPY